MMCSFEDECTPAKTPNLVVFTHFIQQKLTNLLKCGVNVTSALQFLIFFLYLPYWTFSAVVKQVFISGKAFSLVIKMNLRTVYIMK